jgi:hypothetical protein
MSCLYKDKDSIRKLTQPAGLRNAEITVLTIWNQKSGLSRSMIEQERSYLKNCFIIIFIFGDKPSILWFILVFE